MTKNVLKHKLKYSNCSGHVTDDFMSLFWLLKKNNKRNKKEKEKLPGRTLLSRKFSLPCDENQLSTILLRSSVLSNQANVLERMFDQTYRLFS